MSSEDGTRTGSEGEPPQVLELRRTARREGAYLRLWFALADLPWRSLVLVPGHPGGSAEEAARTLAEIGEKVSGYPVRSVSFATMDYPAALAVNDLQEQLRRTTVTELQSVQAIDVESHEVPADEADQAQAAPAQAMVAVTPAARFVVSIPCILSQPVGMAAMLGADAVVVLAERGLSRLDDLERIVERAGRERVAACFLVS